MTRKEMEQLLLGAVSASRLMQDARYITSEDRESGSPCEKRAA